MRRVRRANRLSTALAVLVLAATGGVLLFSAAPAASVGGAIAVTPSTGLTGGQSVTVTGTGLATSSTGSILECNDDAGQPTVTLPAPIGQDVPVSCSGIAITGLLTTGADGSLTGTFTVISPTPGPPCGGSYLVACPATDSAGNDPATDAALYPCPPTAAQQTAGVTCTLAYGDAAGDQVTADISFSSGGGGTTTTTSTTSTTGSTTTTTTAATTTTTQATTPTTTPTTTPGGSSTTPTTAPGTLPGYLTVVAGQATMIQGPGFTPGEHVDVAIHSTAMDLGVFTANTTGVAQGSITIPVDTVVGYHHIDLTGETSGHVVSIPAWIITGSVSTLAATGGSTAYNPASGIPPSGGAATGGTSSSGSGSLAYTGAGRGVWVTLAGGILLLDLGYLLMSMFCRPRELALRVGRSVRRAVGTR